MGKNTSKALKIYQVDAFTAKAFKGNPAVICILDEPLADDSMQAIASEMNVSETAFIVPKANNIFTLRWFTPKYEVPLCGHATLATSTVLFDALCASYDEIIFETKSGNLVAKKDTWGIALDFPLDEPIQLPSPVNREIFDAMGIQSYQGIFIGKNTHKLVIHLENEESVKNLTPDFERLKKIHMQNIKGVGITAGMGSDYDFVTRYFNPWAGVNEDPVTGSVHTLLASYWAKLLNKKVLKAYQASQRGGEMTLRLKENFRLEMVGEAIIILKGELYL